MAPKNPSSHARSVCDQSYAQKQYFSQLPSNIYDNESGLSTPMSIFCSAPLPNSPNIRRIHNLRAPPAFNVSPTLDRLEESNFRNYTPSCSPQINALPGVSPEIPQSHFGTQSQTQTPQAQSAENATFFAILAQQRAFDAEQRRLDREANTAAMIDLASQQRSFEADQRRLDREAFLILANQLKENHAQLNNTLYNLNRQITPCSLTHKTASFVRANPPPKFEKGNSLIVHLRTSVEDHVYEYFNHSRQEQVLALTHVFPESIYRKRIVRELAEKLLPSEPMHASDRLPLYRAIASKLDEDNVDTSPSSQPLTPSDDIHTFFERFIIQIEETFDCDIETANAKTLRRMINPRKQLLPASLRNQLDILIDCVLSGNWYKTGVSCRDMERILNLLEQKRDRLEVSEKQVHFVNSLQPELDPSLQSEPENMQTFSCNFMKYTPPQSNPLPGMSMIVPVNITDTCFHCQRNDILDKPHRIKDCPHKHLCGSCLKFRYADSSSYLRDIHEVPSAFACKQHGYRNMHNGSYNTRGIRITHSDHSDSSPCQIKRAPIYPSKFCPSQKRFRNTVEHHNEFSQVKEV